MDTYQIKTVKDVEAYLKEHNTSKKWATISYEVREDGTVRVIGSTVGLKMKL